MTSMPDTANMSLSDRLHAVRAIGRVHQADLAAELRRMGWSIDQTMVSRYENGHRVPANAWAYEVAVHEAVEALVGK